MVLTLRKKILLGYGVALALIAVVLTWAFISLLGLGRASDAILRENYKSILAAGNMIDAIERQDGGALLLLLGHEEEGVSQYQESERYFLEWLARARDNVTIEGEGKIISDIDTAYKSHMADFAKLRMLKEKSPQEAAAFYHEGMLPSFRAVRDACIRLREINQQTMFEASARAKQVSARALWSVGIIGAAAIGVGLIFSLLLSNLLVRPLKSLVDATQQIADGKYDVKISSGSSDELGNLAQEFNVMARKLKAYHDLNIEQVIAEKRKSEAIIRSIDDGIVVVDAEFRVANLNPTAAGILGMEEGETGNRHFLEVIRSEQLFEYVKQAVESGKPPSIAEGQNIFTVERQQKPQHYLFSITPVHSKAGALVGVVLVFRDVTKLKELDRLKTEFVMTASHELRTPLTGIGMSIDLLRETAGEKLEKKEQALLAAAHEETERLKALVNDLLDLSKMEAGKVDMQMGRVSVATLLEKAAAALRSQAEEKTIALSIYVPPDMPEVKADPNKITWVLTNLIGNALRYAKSGGHIRLAGEHLGAQAHISVADDGAGIPYEYQSRIFDKFVQVKGAEESGGTGLGLAICKEIVRAHGGTIWVDSAPGRGSVFTFTLPIAE
ncbi:MAG: ATP-binding protein [Planctomycetota bacterium]